MTPTSGVTLQDLVDNRGFDFIVVNILLALDCRTLANCELVILSFIQTSRIERRFPLMTREIKYTEGPLSENI